MSTPLRLINRDDHRKSVTVREFVDDVFGEQELNRREADVLLMREHFTATTYIGTHEEFDAAMLRFFVHVQDWFSGTKTDPTKVNRVMAMAALTRWYGRPLHEAERNALYVRESGGFIGVVNKMMEAITNEQLEAYFQSMFFAYIPVDQDARIRLAEEFMNQYGKYLYSGPDLKKAPLLAGGIEEAIKRLVISLRPARKLAQW